MPDIGSLIPSRSRRPVYLVIALAAGWTMGVGGFVNGCETLRFYQSPNKVSVDQEPAASKASDDTLGAYMAEQQRVTAAVRIEALDLNRGRMVPLGAANMLLSLMLIVASVRGMSPRRNARSLLLQALAANAVLVIADYFVSAPVRHAVLKASVGIAVRSAPNSSEANIDPAQMYSAVAWVMRLGCLAEVAIFGLIAFAVTRPRVVAFFHSGQGRSSNGGN